MTIRETLMLAMRRARFPEHFDQAGNTMPGTRPSWYPNDAIRTRLYRNAPHDSDERRLATMLTVLQEIREIELELLAQCTEVAMGMKAARDAKGIEPGSVDDEERVHALVNNDDTAPCGESQDAHGGASIERDRITCLACRAALQPEFRPTRHITKDGLK